MSLTIGKRSLFNYANRYFCLKNLGDSLFKLPPLTTGACGLPATCWGPWWAGVQAAGYSASCSCWSPSSHSKSVGLVQKANLLLCEGVEGLFTHFRLSLFAHNARKGGRQQLCFFTPSASSAGKITIIRGNIHSVHAAKKPWRRLTKSCHIMPAKYEEGGVLFFLGPYRPCSHSQPTAKMAIAVPFRCRDQQTV